MCVCVALCVCACEIRTLHIHSTYICICMQEKEAQSWQQQRQRQRQQPGAVYKYKVQKSVKAQEEIKKAKLNKILFSARRAPPHSISFPFLCLFLHSPLSFACSLVTFRRVKNASGIFILVFKVFFLFFASPFAFLVCVCVSVWYTYTQRHTRFIHNKPTHTHAHHARLSFVFQSCRRRRVSASCARPIVVAALFVCCSCNCCWRRKHRKPCKAVKRPWQMAAQYTQELI